MAPRCTAADSLLVVSVVGGRVTGKTRLSIPVGTLMDLMGMLKRHRIDTLVCGGLNEDAREALDAEAVDVVDNVACSVQELYPALERGVLRSGYGLSESGIKNHTSPSPTKKRKEPGSLRAVDCIRCVDRVCLSGENCLEEPVPAFETGTGEIRRVLEAAADVSLERERRLCRLAELVYFFIEMQYKTVGLAYCVDLEEPAGILAGILRRFFEVVPVCCKIGGSLLEPSVAADGERLVACNPMGQAWLLNRAGSDINVAVGLCVGADMIFSGLSEAPVTTLFVKDKSLANNPIGALYSEYYLRESLSPFFRQPTGASLSITNRREASDTLSGPLERRGPEERS
ncbi:MAG: DUF1847 domain-containing protein [Acidobacteriota bacterium]